MRWLSKRRGPPRRQHLEAGGENPNPRIASGCEAHERGAGFRCGQVAGATFGYNRVPEARCALASGCLAPIRPGCPTQEGDWVPAGGPVSMPGFLLPWVTPCVFRERCSQPPTPDRHLGSARPGRRLRSSRVRWPPQARRGPSAGSQPREPGLERRAGTCAHSTGRRTAQGPLAPGQPTSGARTIRPPRQVLHTGGPRAPGPAAAPGTPLSPSVVPSSLGSHSRGPGRGVSAPPPPPSWWLSSQGPGVSSPDPAQAGGVGGVRRGRPPPPGRARPTPSLAARGHPLPPETPAPPSRGATAGAAVGRGPGRLGVQRCFGGQDGVCNGRESPEEEAGRGGGRRAFGLKAICNLCISF